MAAKILNGNELAKKIKSSLKEDVDKLKIEGIVPGLAVIIVGDDPASRVYVNMKKKNCEEIGITSFEYALSKESTEEELISLINKLNKDTKVNGILVQMPIPKHIDEFNVINAIDPLKDVDGFHPETIGRLMIGKPGFLPCTPAGIMELIKENGIEIAGKECVIVNRSNIVGKPLALLMLTQNATVTICHSRTKDLEEVCKRADILVAAIGKPEFFKGSSIKPGAVVIDVGVNRVGEKKLVGDVELSSASEVASYITPPVGGVGPMTRAMLLKNTVAAAIKSNKK